MKRNLLIIIVSSILLLLMLPSVVLREVYGSVISPRCPEMVACGQEITIPIEINDSPQIAAFGMDVVFPSQFVYQRCEKEECVTEKFQFLDCNVSSETGNLKIGGFSIDPVAAGSNGCLVEVTFTISSVCKGPFTLSVTNLVDNIKGAETEPCQITTQSNNTTSSTASGTTTCVSTSSTTTIASTTTITSTTTTRKICPAMVSLEGNFLGLEMLRMFKENILSKTSLGRKYINLYYEHATEIANCLLADSDLRSQSVAIINKILPKIERLMDGQHVKIESVLLSQITVFLDDLEMRSSPTLKIDIQRLRKDLTKEKLFRGTVVF